MPYDPNGITSATTRHSSDILELLGRQREA
jgi:hypothetical protein